MSSSQIAELNKTAAVATPILIVIYIQGKKGQQQATP